MSPCILLLGRSNYIGVARLPKALQEAGAEVGVVAHRGDYLAATHFLRWKYSWPRRKIWGGAGAKLLAFPVLFWVIVRRQPALIIPTDESSLKLLYCLRACLGWLIGLFAPDARMGLQRSLPDSREAYRLATLRWPNQCLARDLKIDCPAAAEIHSWSELQDFMRHNPGPVVLKQDFTIAGNGVRICRDAAAAEQAWPALGVTLQTPCLVQTYQAGQQAMCAVAVLDGQVLSHLSAVKTHVFPAETGPSSAVRLIDHPGMLAAAGKIAAALGWSGLMSCDFMLDPVTGRSWLIECNPRPVPICHLGPLAQTLVQALGGKGQAAAPPPSGTEIALYPQEWLRLAGRPVAGNMMQDIPHDDAGLLTAYAALLSHGGPATGTEPTSS